ncbi:galactose-3-O-sulfotransferase 3-like [Ylistrum balloti]|uniref:galactose-3-O-sulfotransferase 3-like n=1 Tax=Ylistrum balloti TaxID=509963 RepID=UPI00290594BB|nr:galactose-3-O-sulfotransferase 3-like [Ylistrum balloti]
MTNRRDIPIHHVAFIKVHKAASTSVQNIFYRYGYHHNLSVAQPRFTTGLLWSSPVVREKFLPPPKGQKKYDLMCVHSTYSRTAFDKLLPNDSVYIGIVREPFKQFASSVNYYQRNRVLNIPGNNPVRTFLTDALGNQRFVSTSDHRVFNTQSRDFGTPLKLLSSKYDEYQFRRYLQQLDKELDLVLLVERFAESMVLMRRLLKWEVKDIISAKLNGRGFPPRFQFGVKEEQLVKRIAQYDYALYDFFKKKFQEKIEHQPPDFYDELAYFKQASKRYNEFCISLQKYNKDTSDVLKFEETTWNKPFTVTIADFPCNKNGTGNQTPVPCNKTELETRLKIRVTKMEPETRLKFRVTKTEPETRLKFRVTKTDL